MGPAQTSLPSEIVIGQTIGLLPSTNLPTVHSPKITGGQLGPALPPELLALCSGQSITIPHPPTRYILWPTQRQIGQS